MFSGRTDNSDSFIMSLLSGPSTGLCLYHWNLFEALWSMVCPSVPSKVFTGMIGMPQPFAPPVPDAPGIWQVDHSALRTAECALCLPMATAVACWLNMLWAALCCSRSRVAESGHKSHCEEKGHPLCQGMLPFLSN